MRLDLDAPLEACRVWLASRRKEVTAQLEALIGPRAELVRSQNELSAVGITGLGDELQAKLADLEARADRLTERRSRLDAVVRSAENAASAGALRRALATVDPDGPSALEPLLERLGEVAEPADADLLGLGEAAITQLAQLRALRALARATEDADERWEVDARVRRQEGLGRRLLAEAALVDGAAVTAVLEACRVLAAELGAKAPHADDPATIAQDLARRLQMRRAPKSGASKRVTARTKRPHERSRPPRSVSGPPVWLVALVAVALWSVSLLMELRWVVSLPGPEPDRRASTQSREPIATGPLLLVATRAEVRVESLMGEVTKTLLVSDTPDAVVDPVHDVLWIRSPPAVWAVDLRHADLAPVQVLDAVGAVDVLEVRFGKRAESRTWPATFDWPPYFGASVVRITAGESTPQAIVAGVVGPSPGDVPRHLEAAEGRARRIGMLNTSWLAQRAGRKARTLDRRRLGSAGRVRVPGKRSCDAAPCGSAAAFGETGWFLVLTRQWCAEGCGSECSLFDPKRGRWADPVRLKWSARPVDGSCGPYLFDPSGTRWAAVEARCTVADGCRDFAGTNALGWTQAGPIVGHDGATMIPPALIRPVERAPAEEPTAILRYTAGSLARTALGVHEGVCASDVTKPNYVDFTRDGQLEACLSYVSDRCDAKQRTDASRRLMCTVFAHRGGELSPLESLPGVCDCRADGVIDVTGGGTVRRLRWHHGRTVTDAIRRAAPGR